MYWVMVNHTSTDARFVVVVERGHWLNSECSDVRRDMKPAFGMYDCNVWWSCTGISWKFGCEWIAGGSYHKIHTCYGLPYTILKFNKGTHNTARYKPLNCEMLCFLPQLFSSSLLSFPQLISTYLSVVYLSFLREWDFEQYCCDVQKTLHGWVSCDPHDKHLHRRPHIWMDWVHLVILM